MSTIPNAAVQSQIDVSAKSRSGARGKNNDFASQLKYRDYIDFSSGDNYLQEKQ